MEPTTIEIKNARVHNLRSVSLSLPRNSLIVFTGVSGSGKSSLAFDTLYAEGQRRYIESLSSYARQFMGQMEKPDVDLITGLSPSIAIGQKKSGWNPRSTVGTVTAIHDFLRVLYARIGTQHCTKCGRAITAQSREQIIAGILAAFTDKSRLLVLAPVAKGQKGEFRDLFDDLLRAGYVRARVDGEVVELREDSALVKNQRHDIEVVIDRLVLSDAERNRLAEAVEAALRVGKGTMIVTEMPESRTPSEEANTRHSPQTPPLSRLRSVASQSPYQGEGESGRAADRNPRAAQRATERIFSSKYACVHCDISFEPPSPQLFSFNAPAGMCMTCDGLGELLDFDLDKLIPDPSLDFYAPCIAPMRTAVGKWRRHLFEGVAKSVGFDIRKPWKDLPKKARDALLFGTGERHITYEWRWSGGVWKHGGTFAGVLAELRDKHRQAKASFVREYYEKFMRRGPCPNCNGAKLNSQALGVRLSIAGSRAGLNIQEFCALPVARAREAVDRLALTPIQKAVAEEVLKEIRARLDFLLNVGLDYLTLERSAPSLSGGELQRIRLAGQIGSGLVGVLYVLDEPSIGLHARDNEKLLASLLKLRDMGNTVVVVEHDEATMRTADHIVDFGPGPGVRGGEVVAEGDVGKLMRHKKSLTGQYLAGRRKIDVPANRRPVAPRNSIRHKRGPSRG